MSLLQYMMLGMCAFTIIGTPYMLVKSIQRKQAYRLVEIPVCDSLMIYLTVDMVWPAAIQSASPLVHYLVLVVLVLGIADFFGVIRWLFNRQKAVPVGRS